MSLSSFQKTNGVLTTVMRRTKRRMLRRGSVFGGPRSWLVTFSCGRAGHFEGEVFLLAILLKSAWPLRQRQDLEGTARRRRGGVVAVRRKCFRCRMIESSIRLERSAKCCRGKILDL